MALQEARLAWSRALRLTRRPHQIRCASTAAAEAPAPLDELEQSSFDAPLPSTETIKSYNPVVIAAKRGRPLPASRYKFRPPKYYRGPLHPHQPPPPEDIASRAFIPGPFTIPRTQETYESFVESDMLTLCYTHQIPGQGKRDYGDRMRHWVGDSPYYENRPPRGPRGGSSRLAPIHKPITYYNIPQLKKITVHSHMSEANSDSAYLHTGGMALQTITGVRVETRKSKKSVVEWGAKKGKYSAVICTLEGEIMHHFLAKLTEIVMPRIKEWKGVSGGSGDSTGNISFGLKPEDVALFPEIEVNYDMYPPQMIPGCHVTIHTTAVTDREARLLLSAIGIPFHGKMKKN